MGTVTPLFGRRKVDAGLAAMFATVPTPTAADVGLYNRFLLDQAAVVGTPDQYRLLLADITAAGGSS